MPGEMLRWNDLLTYLETNHAAIQQFPGDRFRFAYRVAGAAVKYPDGTEIAFGGYIVRSPTGSPWLVVALKLAAHEEVRPRPALVANFDLSLGSIAVIAGFAMLRQSMPLEGLRHETFERTLAVVASLAGELRAAKGRADASAEAEFDAPYAYIYR